jgi:hypothetical protein
VWKFAVDWSTNPPTSSFGTGSTPPSGTTPGVGGDPNFTIPVAQFIRASANSCVYGETFPNCIPQYNGVSGPAPQGLDILGDRLMFRAAYRNFGANPPSGIPANTESLTLNLSVQVVDTNNLPRIGIRWMEVRNPLGVSGSPSIYQQGTYALADATTHPLWRWMGSVAMDHAGDVALGFSTSGPNDYPTIRYAGRLATDPPASLGTLTQTEVTIPSGPRSVAYGGPQTEPEGRWGDYSDMTIDPVNDCTFWYTQEYLETLFVVIGNWRTRVGAFRFANCTFSPTAVAVNAFSARWTRAGATIAWRTAEETDALGFNVYRVNARGALTRVNPTLIRARHSGRTTGALYRFLDRGATRRNATTYKLQLVDLQGKRSWYGVGTTP